MTKLRGLVYGWGINDVEYDVVEYGIVNGKSKPVKFCPYWLKWRGLLQRCLDSKLHDKHQTYKGCTVCEEWKYLSNFIRWVDSQPNRDWVNCSLDKDLLFIENKHYSPETCVFVSVKVNSFLLARTNMRGKFMLGVVEFREDHTTRPYRATCRDPFAPDKSSKHIGYFATELEAHKAWQAKKHEYACQLADLQDDPRVAKALRERYAPDKDWTNK